jgi:Cu/Ag efflux protein CusF
MRAWHAAALINLALLVALAGGWQAWQRETGRADAQAVQTITLGPEREWHDLRGVVRAVVPDLGIIVLTHEDIPGYMPGMTMGFRIATPKIPESLSVGDAVRFSLRGAPPLVVLTAIDKSP